MDGTSVSGGQILLPLVLSILVLWAARALGFFHLPAEAYHRQIPRITFLQVIAVFAIYLGCSFLVPTLITNVSSLSTLSPVRLAYSQVAALLSSAFFLALFCLLQKDKPSMRKVWKRNRTPISSIRRDIGFGMLAWIVSFPVVNLVSVIADMFVNSVFGPQQYEQVAVKYLKTSLQSNFSIILLALITIIIAAPLIEELLFRGFLQNFLKRYLGVKAAILLAAFIFALFHFSLSQDLGNIPLVASLFVLALFLGFIYERQQSLFSSISLHITFNAISVLRIVFT